jgi:hypothetical protein
MALGGAIGGGGLGATSSAAPSSGGGKSSGLGQGGYGGAPAFQQSTAQTQPSFAQSPYGMPSLSTNSTTQQDMMGGNKGSGQSFNQTVQGLGMMGGGKSSGLGQGGYGAAPGFQQQQQQQMMQPQFNPYQQQQFNPYQQQQFNPYQQQQFNPYQQQQFNPYQQQQFNPYQQQQGVSGLQSLYNNMVGQQQMQRQQMQRPLMQQYQDPALQYRPNMQNAQSALSRVRPSVQRQGQDAQAARIAELEAQIAGFQAPVSNSFDYGNSG